LLLYAKAKESADRFSTTQRRCRQRKGNRKPQC